MKKNKKKNIKKFLEKNNPNKNACSIKRLKRKNEIK